MISHYIYILVYINYMILYCQCKIYNYTYTTCSLYYTHNIFNMMRSCPSYCSLPWNILIDSKQLLTYLFKISCKFYNHRSHPMFSFFYSNFLEFFICFKQIITNKITIYLLFLCFLLVNLLLGRIFHWRNDYHT